MCIDIRCILLWRIWSIVECDVMKSRKLSSSFLFRKDSCFKSGWVNRFQALSCFEDYIFKKNRINVIFRADGLSWKFANHSEYFERIVRAVPLGSSQYETGTNQRILQRLSGTLKCYTPNQNIIPLRPCRSYIFAFLFAFLLFLFIVLPVQISTYMIFIFHTYQCRHLI